jgi:hypothetical protein
MSGEQQAFDFGKDSGILAAAAAQFRQARPLRHIEQFIEQGIGAKPLLWSQLVGGWAAGMHLCLAVYRVGFCTGYGRQGGSVRRKYFVT